MASLAKRYKFATTNCEAWVRISGCYSVRNRTNWIPSSGQPPPTDHACSLPPAGPSSIRPCRRACCLLLHTTSPVTDAPARRDTSTQTQTPSKSWLPASSFNATFLLPAEQHINQSSESLLRYPSTHLPTPHRPHHTRPSLPHPAQPIFTASTGGKPVDFPPLILTSLFFRPHTPNHSHTKPSPNHSSFNTKNHTRTPHPLRYQASIAFTHTAPATLLTSWAPPHT